MAKGGITLTLRIFSPSREQPCKRSATCLAPKEQVHRQARPAVETAEHGTGGRAVRPAHRHSDLSDAIPCYRIAPRPSAISAGQGR